MALRWSKMLNIDSRARHAIVLALLVASAAADAATFTAPEQLVFQGRVYRLDYQKPDTRGNTLYDYTTSEEEPESWTTLIRLKFNPRSLADRSKWIMVMDNSLEHTLPKPFYKTYVEGDYAYVRYVLDPIPHSPMFESNVHRAYHTHACGGFLVYQYSVNYALGNDLSDTVLAAKRRSIIEENQRLATELEKLVWEPSCSN